MQGEGEDEAKVYKKAHLGESLGQLYFNDEVGLVLLLLGQQFSSCVQNFTAATESALTLLHSTNSGF
jgi:hypothetical protein